MGNYIKRIFRLKRWLKIIQFRLSDPVYRFAKNQQSEVPRLLLIKTEAIGDYVFFRNFLKVIREHKLYKDYHITLVGNTIWESLALHFDANIVDSFILLDRKRFQIDQTYRHQKLAEISSQHYDVAINATFSREFLLGDSIMRSVSATQKIGMRGDNASEIPPVKELSNSFYNHLIDVPAHFTFEFQKNKAFFETLLNEKISMKAPYFDIKKSSENKVLILPGAQDSKRQWSPEKFHTIANYLHQTHSCDVIVAGGPMDYEAAEIIIGSDKPQWMSNVCGKLNLAELVQLMAGATLAICNDSGTLHMAAACGIKVIGISNGNHFGRFTPYPAECGREVWMIYPPKLASDWVSFEKKMKAMEHGSTYSIQDIEPQQVMDTIKLAIHG